MNPHVTHPVARQGLGRLPALALVLALAVAQSGCCCFECIEHCAAPLSYFPPRSALTPRNPPCGFVDPMCYGYHATCWRSWPEDCDQGRDCLDWCQQDALPLPAKGDMAPPMEPVPANPDQPAAPMPEAPAPMPPASPASPAPPPNEPEEEPALEESADAHVRPAAELSPLAPIVSVKDLPESAELPASEGRPQRSARRTVVERLPRVELP